VERRLTTQDISWFLDLHRNSQLNLEPPYQRRSVWTRKDRLFFLDTVFKGYPCPAIFLHKEIDGVNGKATYHVVDGKQRLETIVLFAESRLSMSKDHGDDELKGKKFKDLSTDYKKRFWNFVVGVDQLDIVEESIVDEVFDRLNRNSRKLERQELRHAKYDGWFITFAEDQSEHQSWKNIGITTTARAKRMKDVQFISELMVALIENGCQGFSQDALDEYSAKYDLPEEDTPDFVIEDFVEEFNRLRDYLVSCNEVNNCVEKYARNFMHFYSLWCLSIELSDKIEASTFATKYEEFMQSYQAEGSEAEESTPLGQYKLNSVGANTDLPQRLARHEAIMGCFS